MTEPNHNTPRQRQAPGTVLIRLLLGPADRPRASGFPSGPEMRRYLLAALIAAIPCYLLASRWFGARLWLMWAAAFAGGALVEIAVSVTRRRPIGGGIFVYAALFALIVPPDVPLWMVTVGMIFGTLFGKEVFGGTGFHIFSPVLVAKGFLLFSYPARTRGLYFGNLGGLSVNREFLGTMVDMPIPEAWMLAAGVTAIAIVTMAVARPANLRIIAAILLGGTGTALALLQGKQLPYDSVVRMLGSDGFLFGACFLACDPSCSPRHDEAKWLYGLLVGAVAVMMRSFSTYTESMLCALLLGNLFTPMLDLIAAREAREEVSS